MKIEVVRDRKLDLMIKTIKVRALANAKFTFGHPKEK
jgi:hypothetical protein